MTGPKKEIERGTHRLNGFTLGRFPEENIPKIVHA